MARKHKQPKIDPRVSDALREHALQTRWYEKARGRKMLRGFSQYDGLLRETFRKMRLDGETEFPDYMLHMMRSAETFAIAPDMHDLIEGLARGQATDTLPPSMGYHELVAQTGFVLLPKPIYSKDISMTNYPITAMAWMVDPTRVYADDGDPGSGQPLIATAMWNEPFEGDPLQEQLGDTPIPGPRLTLLHFGQINIANLHMAWGELSDGGRHILPAHTTEAERLEYQLPARYMVLFWLVANQKLAAERRYEGPEQLGGISTLKAREAKIVPRVRVITLRRDRIHTEPDPGRPGREYSHRWPVAAYWNQYHVGPGRTETVWRLVRAHVRGPDDKPLIVKERAFDLRR